ncbi:MAG: acetyl-CoA carboxylase biotin carboxyl carrier protein [Thermoanaerobaculales bacterium]|nr:acetyl-CoA carboxylase biotin carboxyl carrier protein [Thermoanaerobaculales bacterium]
MFKFDELCELIRLVGSSGVAGVEIEHAGGRLRIDGKPVVAPVIAAPLAAPVGPALAAPVAPGSVDPGSPAAAVEAAADDNLHYVTSPIVGTFYRAPNPDAEPYVRVGDAVDVGRTLCIVEAMKLMNEIECDRSGTIVKVFPDNAQPVEFGERLFAIRLS